MKCPYCRGSRTDVYNTRQTRFGSQIWRRRRCLACGESFTTYEQPDLAFLRVKRSDGFVRRYSRSKLFSGIYEAFNDTSTKPDTIDNVTDTIEAKILDLKHDIVSADQINSIVLVTLKHFSMPAFLRYLSSHAELRSTAEVKRLLKDLR